MRPVAADAPAPSAVAPRTAEPPVRFGDGGALALTRVPLRACDDACLRARGPAFLRVLRLMHRTPDRMRRLLHAFDLPYARLWMAWLAHRDGDAQDARASLSEAREALASRSGYEDERRAVLRGLSREGTVTMTHEIMSDLRVQFDHWARLDPALGQDAAVMAPCAQLAMEGAVTRAALRPRGGSGDEPLATVTARCGRLALEQGLASGEQAAALAALEALWATIVALAPAGDAGSPPPTALASATARARLFEPWFLPDVEPEDSPLRGAALGTDERRALARWNVARAGALSSWAGSVCAIGRRARPTLTAPQCAERARRAAEGAAALWLLGARPASASSPVDMGLAR